jgi:hypothetical protein
VLEASGVAEPSSIARTFTSDVFRSPIRLDGVVAVVDAEQLPAQAEDPTTRDLVFGQIGYADIVVLNKIDLADRAQIDAVRTFVHDRLPMVRIIETTRAQVPFDVMLGVGPREAAAAAAPSTHDDHGHRTEVFEHWTYARERAVDIDELLSSIRLLPRSVYRIKGFVHNAHDPDHRYLLQAVGQRAEVHSFDRWAGATLATELVIIADRTVVDRAAIDAQLDTCLVGQPLTSTTQTNGCTMADEPLDELGPVDFVIVEFPAGESNFTGEAADELIALIEAGTVRLIDLLILTKDADGNIDAMELSDLDDLGPFQQLEAELAQFLAEDDVEHLAAAMDPGSVAAVIVYENLWAAPFASAARRAGGQLIANGRIPAQAIIAALEADESLDPLEVQGA